MKQSIRTNILSVFLVLLGFIALALLSSQYYFSHKIAEKSTHETFKLITTNIAQHLKSDAELIKNILVQNINNHHLNEEINFEYKHKVLEEFIQILKINPKLYSVYFVHKDGSFYELINMNETEKLYELYKAPKKTKWLVITSKKGNVKYTFLDKKRVLISSYMLKKDYNPLNRSWYKEAIKSNKVIFTEPYKFSNIEESGISYAVSLENKGSVLGVDYTLNKINAFLKLQASYKNSEIFIFNKNGDKVASSTYLASTVKPTLMKLFLSQQEKHLIKYKHQDTEYFTVYRELSNKNLFLGIKLDAKILLEPYVQNFQYSLFIAFGLLLISIPTIFFITSVMVRPVKALKFENEKIKNRKFETVQGIKTNIVEYLELSDSLVNMSKSICDYQKSQEELLDAIVKLIAEAIDAKSPYTGGHCKRVPKIAQMLLQEASTSTEKPFEDFSFSSKEKIREFEIAAWLHDCGKVTTPEYVIDKATKLETINNRIHEIRTRFEVLFRDVKINYLISQLENTATKEEALAKLHLQQQQLKDDFAFIATANIGGEFMTEDKQKRIKQIANQEWQRNFDNSLGLGEQEELRYKSDTQNQQLPVIEKLLSDKKSHIIKRENFNFEQYEKDGFKEEVPVNLYNYGEVYNLSLQKGTLTPEERYKINEHVIFSIKMLEKIPFPKNMTKIPEYAGSHHETLIGTGYPRKLTEKELSIPSKIMAIADIFEALTASDRPYKKAKTLSESIKILSFMVKDKHIDEDLFKLFLTSGIYKQYAKEYLKDIQIDEIDIEKFI